MEKVFFLFLAFTWSIPMYTGFAHFAVPQYQNDSMKIFYDFEVNSIDGEPYDLHLLEGKRILVVNTASECGYTPQYAQLQELYDNFNGEEFVILGFPANNFGGQEPGSNTEIQAFCQKNYGVTFPMMEKISVKGDDAHPLFLWLTRKSHNGVADAEVSWNFNKFLIDESVKWVAHYDSRVQPLDPRLIDFARGE